MQQLYYCVCQTLNYEGYTHRQNCLEDVGILIALHKLQICDNGILQDM